MIELRQLDIWVEMIDLCQHLLYELRHQLSYFKASVYKKEAKESIDSKLYVLGILLEIFGDENISELWSDFCADDPSHSPYPPGECRYSLRIHFFLSSLEKTLEDFYHQMNQKATSQESLEKMTLSIRNNASKIRSICDGRPPIRFLDQL